MSWLVSINKPWLHFVVLGMVFYQLQSIVFPEPKPVIGPLSEPRIAALEQQWRASTGRAPTQDQIMSYVAVELDRDMLLQRAIDLGLHLHDLIIYQRLVVNMDFLQLGQSKSESERFDQAIAMQMHLDDEVVKRRLIQLMEQRLVTEFPPAKPNSEQVQTAFLDSKDALRHPARYTIEHVFFAPERLSEVSDAVETITRENLDPQSARGLGSPFLQGYQFVSQSTDQLARNFGDSFVLDFEKALNVSGTTKAASGKWLGLVRSVYGVHYVWLSEFEPERDVEFAEVESQIRRDLAYAASKQALACAIAALRSEFDVRGVAQRYFNQGSRCE